MTVHATSPCRVAGGYPGHLFAQVKEAEAQGAFHGGREGGAALRTRLCFRAAPAASRPPFARAGRTHGRILHHQTGGLLVGAEFGQAKTATTDTGADPEFPEGVSVKREYLFEPL